MQFPEMPILRRSEVFLKYLLASLLIFIPLYPKFPLFFLPGSKVAIRAEDFLFFLSFVGLAIHYFRQKINLLKVPLARQMATYWLVGLVSLICAILITKNIFPSVGFLHWLRRIEYMFGFFLAYEVCKKNIQNVRFSLEIIIICSIAVLLYGLSQIFLNAPIVSTMNEEFSKGYTLILQPGVPISSTFAGHYDLAIYLSFILAVLTALHKYQKNRVQALCLSILICGELWLLLQTGLRIAVAASFISVCFVLIIQKNYRYLVFFSAIFALGVINSPRLTGRFNNLFRVIKINNISEQILSRPIYAQENPDLPTPPPSTPRPIQQDRSTSIRLDVEWPRALRAFSKNPFLGTGYSSITLATDNDYLRSMGETGALGLLSFAAILIAIFKKCSQKLKSPPQKWWQSFSLAYSGVFITMLIAATFIDVFEASKVASFFWILTGIFFAPQKS